MYKLTFQMLKAVNTYSKWQREWQALQLASPSGSELWSSQAYLLPPNVPFIIRKRHTPVMHSWCAVRIMLSCLFIFLSPFLLQWIWKTSLQPSFCYMSLSWSVFQLDMAEQENFMLWKIVNCVWSISKKGHTGTVGIRFTDNYKIPCHEILGKMLKYIESLVLT